MLHLGMSGSLRILPAPTPPQKHDHVDLVLDSGLLLRYRDPRRFGSVFWLNDLNHRLLNDLGTGTARPGIQWLNPAPRGPG